MTTTLLNLVNTIYEEICSVQLKVAALKGYVQGFYDFQKNAEPTEPANGEAAAEKASNLLQIAERAQKKETEKGIHKFTKKEINSMPEKFKVIFNKKVRTAHWRTRADGYQELRCMIDGVSYSGTGKTEKAAIENFINSLYKEEDPNAITKNITFRRYVDIWLETVKKPNVKEKSYSLYVREIENHIYPVLGDKKIATIKQFEIQNLINSYIEQNKVLTANKIYSYLSSIFAYAEIDKLVQQSPMKKIVVKKAKVIHGVAFSREEEKALVSALSIRNKDLPYIQAFVFILYTGLRKSELASVMICNDWIIVNSAKQRLGDEKIRKLPINPMLKKLLPLIDIPKIKSLDCGNFGYWLHKICPKRHVHELRHTFITRCQEYGIRREIVSLWVGHSADSSITASVYTHLEQNQELQIIEAQKLNYEL